MALTSSMFVGSEGRERGTEVRRDEDGWITLFYTGKASDQCCGGRDPAWGTFLPQLRGLTHVGCDGVWAQGSKAQPGTLPPLHTGTQTLTPSSSISSRPSTQGGHLLAPGLPPVVKGLPPVQAGSQGASQGQARERDCLGQDDTQTTRLGHGAELC